MRVNLPTRRSSREVDNSHEPARRARAQHLPLVVLFAFAFSGPALIDSPKFISILTIAAIFGIVAVSLDLVLGYAGLLSLGQTVPFGVSAYVAAVLTTTHEWPPELAAVVAIAAAVTSAAISSPVLRLDGFYFALATLALVIIFEAVTKNWISTTGGSSGFVGIGYLDIGPIHLRSPSDYFIASWLALALVTVVALNITRSRVGRGLLAIHEDWRAASALGVPTSSLKIRIWLASAGIAGVAGVLYAHYIRFLSPEQFGQTPAIVLVAAVVIGGTRTIYGAIVGVVVVRMLPAVFEAFAERSILVYGMAIIVATIAMPQGIVGVVLDRLRRRQLKGTAA